MTTNLESILKPSESKKILIAALNWGLGHATRTMPIINALLDRGHEVSLATDGVALALWKQEYPALSIYEVPGYAITYQKRGSFALNLAKQLPRVNKVIKAERRWLAQLLEKTSFDLVISDNRYGFSTSKIPCVLMSHQLRILMPNWLKPLEWITHKLVMGYAKEFNFLWVPDYPSASNSLAGKLVYGYPLPKHTRFVGPLTRFKAQAPASAQSDAFILVVLSGPEPQRSLLEEKILVQASERTETFIIVQGLPSDQVISDRPYDHIIRYNFLKAAELEQLLRDASMVISRSGYSTLLDLHELGKCAIFIPTPGQTEQEYIAKHLLASQQYYAIAQSKLNLDVALEAAKTYQPKIKKEKNDLLEKALEELLNTI